MDRETDKTRVKEARDSQTLTERQMLGDDPEGSGWAEQLGDGQPAKELSQAPEPHTLPAGSPAACVPERLSGQVRPGPSRPSGPAFRCHLRGHPGRGPGRLPGEESVCSGVSSSLWLLPPPPPPEPQKWVPILGDLQKTLQKGEYLPLRPLPMFESNFVQVTNHGAPALVHHKTNKLTMGVAASLPGLVLPDILLLARPPEDRDCSNLNLTRMIPLDLAHLYVHDLPTWRLKLRLITGRYYYLELDAPDHELGFLFDRWLRLINLLHEPTISWAPRTMSMPTLHTTQDGVPASTWRLQDQSGSRLTAEVAERTFPCKMFSSQKQRKNKMAKHRFRSQAVGDSLPLLWSQLQPPKDQMKVTEKKAYPGACPAGSKTLIHVSEKASITIRTIFSIISGTMNQDHSSDSEGTIGRGRLIETPTQRVSHNACDLAFGDSRGHMDTFLWTQDLDKLIDTESTSLSSPLRMSSYPPAFYIFPPGSSLTKSSDKAKPKPIGSMKYMSSPITSGKTPFIWDKSNKVPAEPASAQKAPAAPRSTRKSSAKSSPFYKTPPSGSQKTSSVPGPPRKAPVLVTQPQKTLTPVLKRPQAPAGSQKAVPPKKDTLVLNTQSQAPTARSQKAPDSEAKAPVDPSMVQAGDMLERKSEGKQAPGVLGGEQKKKAVEMKTTSPQLPRTTTKKQSKEVLISKTQEITLEALKGRGKSEERVQKTEKTTVNLPDLKSLEIESQKKWVLTKEVAVEGPCLEDSRPFSVEGLALAKMMIMANSKQQHLKPTTVSLPSWFSMTSRASAMSVLANLPFNTSQMTLPERTQVVVREQSSSYTKMRENKPRQMEKNPPKGSLKISKEPTAELPKTVNISLKDTSQPPTTLTAPISRTESSVRVPPKPGVKHQGLRQVKQAKTQQQPLAVAGPASEVLLPITLEMEDKRKTATKDEMPVKKAGAHHAQQRPKDLR
ncbi:Golgi-associated RAB2 interactor protein 5B [Peromyscus californicus insignis]|uniref:Golgi-associated RAB2 interactor protein 5B n=1 Tax=Peromyscus californicus insignis TaxID=564181 RepID=UPI0022A68662|nr:Golgi-associated RAB2 interactor protein 5B [Peromyscus californicus insignis]